MSLLRAIARDFWRKSYVKRNFCVSPRRWKLAPRIMPLSYAGYSIIHDTIYFCFCHKLFFYKILCKKSRKNLYLFYMTFSRSCTRTEQVNRNLRIWTSPKLIYSRDQRIPGISKYFSHREWKCIIDVLIANWEIIVSASSEPCPSTSRSNFQRKAVLLQARPANSFLACVAADAK